MLHKTTLQWAPSPQLWLPCLCLYVPPQRKNLAASGKPLHLPLWLYEDAFLLMPETSQPVFLLIHSNGIPRSPQGSEGSLCSSRHQETGKNFSLHKLGTHASIPSPDLHLVQNVTNWSALVTQLVSLIHLQWAFLSQLYTCLNFTDMSLPSLEIFPSLPNKGKRVVGPGGLCTILAAESSSHHLLCSMTQPALMMHRPITFTIYSTKAI